MLNDDGTCSGKYITVMALNDDCDSCGGGGDGGGSSDNDDSGNGYIVVKPSHLLDHMNPKCEETADNVLYYYVLCTVLEY